jgi:phage protein D
VDVKQDDLARRVILKVAIGGHDATSHLKPYLTSFSFADHAEGKSDEISIDLHDRDGKWIGGWLPSKGAGITASIRCLNWWGPGRNLSLNCGKATCDEVTVSGPPGKVVIKAVSASLSGPLRETQRSQGWEAFTLQGVAQDIAARNNLSLFYDADPHHFDRQDQRSESDLAFLQRLADDRGVSLKVHDDRLILFSAKSADARPTKLTFSRAGKGYGVVENYEFKRKSEGTAYVACVVSYRDPASGELRSYTYNPTSAALTDANTGKVLDLDRRVESEADAMVAAQNKLRGANKSECEGSFTVMGHPGLVAGITVAMTGFGKFDGKYFVKKATHRVGNKYTTKAEIRSVLGY